MGTYSLVLNHLAARSGNWKKAGIPSSPTDAEILTLITGGALYAGYDEQIVEESFTLTFGSLGLCWKLDGDTAIAFSTLPAGFHPITSCGVVVQADFFGTGAPRDYYATLPGSGPGEGIANSPQVYSTIPSALSIQNNGCGIRCQVGDNLLSHLGTHIKIIKVSLSGYYDILSYTWDLPNQSPIYKMPKGYGDVLTITAGTLDLSHVAFQLFFNGNIVSWTNVSPTLLTFDIPQYIYNGITPGTYPLVIIGTGDGTQFTGSITLGILQVIIQDASGIYTLVKNLAHDVLYFRGGYTTDINRLMLDFTEYKETDDFYSMLDYPYKVLSQDDIDEDEELFFISSNLRIVTVTVNSEIPNPFIETGFLP